MCWSWIDWSRKREALTISCPGPGILSLRRCKAGPGQKIAKTTPCKVAWTPARSTLAALRPGQEKKGPNLISSRSSLPIGLMPGAVVPAMSVRLALRGLIPNRHDDARISTITSFLGYVGNHGICLYDHSRVDTVEPCINLRFDGARASVHEDFYLHWLWHPAAFRWLMTDELMMIASRATYRSTLPTLNRRSVRADAISESFSSISESLSSIDESLRSTRNIRACCCCRRALLSSTIPIGVLQYVHCTEIIL